MFSEALNIHTVQVSCLIMPITKVCANPAWIGTGWTSAIVYINAVYILNLFMVIAATSSHWKVSFLLSCQGCQFKVFGDFRQALHNLKCIFYIVFVIIWRQLPEGGSPLDSHLLSSVSSLKCSLRLSFLSIRLLCFDITFYSVKANQMLSLQNSCPYWCNH
jgi:hypothetical protein